MVHISQNSAFHEIAHYNPDVRSTPGDTIRQGVAGTGDKAKRFEIRYSDKPTPGQSAAYAANLVAYDKSTLLPHNDAHMHPWDYRQKGVDLEVIVERMKEIGCKHTVVMPIPTSLISLTGDTSYVLAPGHHHCGEAYYVPAKYANEMTLTREMMAEAKTLVELGVDSEVDDNTAAQYRMLSPQDQAKLDPMITGLHLGSTYADIALFRKLDRNPGVFTGGGEITFTKEMVQELFAGRGQADINNNIEPAKQLIAAFGVAGMPVTIHWDVDTPYQNDVNPGNPKHFDAFDRFLSDPKTQNTTITWAHGGGLGRFVLEPQGHLDRLGQLLEKHPNLRLDISWSQVAKQLIGRDMQTGIDKSVTEKEQILNRWAQFINKYSDRIQFGSDTLAPKSDAQWSETLRMYNEPNGLFSRLTPEALADVTEKTYESTFVAARANVRKFEQHVLPHIRHLLTNPDVTMLDMGKLTEFRDEIYASLDAAGVGGSVVTADTKGKKRAAHTPLEPFDVNALFNDDIWKPSAKDAEEDAAAWAALGKDFGGITIASSSNTGAVKKTVETTTTTVEKQTTTKAETSATVATQDDTTAARTSTKKSGFEGALKTLGYYASVGQRFKKYGPDGGTGGSGTTTK